MLYFSPLFPPVDSDTLASFPIPNQEAFLLLIFSLKILCLSEEEEREANRLTNNYGGLKKMLQIIIFQRRM